MRDSPRSHPARAPRWPFGELDLNKHVRWPESQRHRVINRHFGVADRMRDKFEDVAVTTIDGLLDNAVQLKH